MHVADRLKRSYQHRGSLVPTDGTEHSEGGSTCGMYVLNAFENKKEEIVRTPQYH